MRKNALKKLGFGVKLNTRGCKSSGQFSSASPFMNCIYRLLGRPAFTKLRSVSRLLQFSSSSPFSRPLAPPVKLIRNPTVTRVHVVAEDVDGRAGGPQFNALGISNELNAALTGLGIQHPTEIQAKALPAILSGGDYVLASHTGSGKTLAYLLPLINLIKQQEREGFVPRPKRPRALILGPTKELAEQIAGVAKALSHVAKFRSTCLTGSKTKKQQQVHLCGPIDIVVATPTRFLQHVKDGNIFFKDITWLVVDEADTILADATWADELKTIMAPLRARADRPKAGVVLVSATMSKPIRRLIATDFPGIRMLETASLHKGIAGSQHRFVTQPPGRDKLDLLDDILAPDARLLKKVLVFCNTVASCRAVEHHCHEAGLQTVCYHGDMPVHLRQDAMRMFAGTSDNITASMESEEESEGTNEGVLDGGGRRGQQAGASSSGRSPIMIATDVAARGLDFPGTVDHVINFDFPTSPVDYIHRGGRTARAGRTGRVTSIVTARDRTLAQRIEWALEHNDPLDQLSADPSVLPPSQRPKPGAEKELRRIQGAPKGTKGAARLRLGPARDRAVTAPVGWRGSKRSSLARTAGARGASARSAAASPRSSGRAAPPSRVGALSARPGAARTAGRSPSRAGAKAAPSARDNERTTPARSASARSGSGSGYAASATASASSESARSAARTAPSARAAAPSTGPRYGTRTAPAGPRSGARAATSARVGSGAAPGRRSSGSGGVAVVNAGRGGVSKVPSQRRQEPVGLKAGKDRKPGAGRK